jgi:hypothetical protein
LGFFTALQYLPADEQVNRIRLLSALDTLFERQREDARVVPQPPDIGLAACKARAMNAGLLPSAEADECAVFGVRDAVRLRIFECERREYEIRECVRGKLGGVSAGRAMTVKRTSVLLVTMLLKRAPSIFALFLRCWRCTPYTCLVSISPGVYAGSIWDSLSKGRVSLETGTSRTQYFPPFFLERTSRASGEYPGAIIPSDTSREIIFAVARSQGADNPIKSPKDDMRSAPRARA